MSQFEIDMQAIRLKVNWARERLQAAENATQLAKVYLEDVAKLLERVELALPATERESSSK